MFKNGCTACGNQWPARRYRSSTVLYMKVESNWQHICTQDLHLPFLVSAIQAKGFFEDIYRALSGCARMIIIRIIWCRGEGCSRPSHGVMGVETSDAPYLWHARDTQLGCCVEIIYFLTFHCDAYDGILHQKKNELMRGSRNPQVCPNLEVPQQTS
jgi:hypothetical protein